MRRVCASSEPVCHRVFDQVRFALLIQRWSTRSFFTLAFLILPLPLSHAGADAGGSTISVQPLNTCTRFVPRSRKWMSFVPRVAAFRAAPRGCRLAKTWLVSLPPFIRTKYFLSPMRLPSGFYGFPTHLKGYARKTLDCAPIGGFSKFPCHLRRAGAVARMVSFLGNPSTKYWNGSQYIE